MKDQTTQKSRSDIKNPYCVHGNKVSFRYLIGKDIKWKLKAECPDKKSAEQIARLLNEDLGERK